MGHLAAKDVYQKLGVKIDNLTVKAPWNNALYEMLKELYTEEEADVVVKMPYILSNLDKIAKITGYSKDKLLEILTGLAEKGLVIDLYNNGEYYYMISPMVVGIFEFTMMRTKGDVNYKKWAELMLGYTTDDFYRANCDEGQKISIARALPHQAAVYAEDTVEILSYEKAEEIVACYDKFAIGLCSCRHEKFHLNSKVCDAPLDTCATFGRSADYLIRHGMAKEVSRNQMLENFERSKDLGLVLTADSVKQNVTFICSCCSCCCNILGGINKFGYSNYLMTSTFIAEVDADECQGCGKCVKACPINAISLEPTKEETVGEKQQFRAKVDKSICLGCGVCSIKCKYGALCLKKRKQQVIHPETTFERNILISLERGNLQNLIFTDPQAVTHKVMRGMIGGFLRLSPVKRALMEDSFRSRFLKFMTMGSRMQGNEWITKL